MRLPKDILNVGLYTKPNFFLCQPDKEKICKLETTETKGSFKFNSLSEISFETARVYNDLITGETKVNPYYDLIEALRLIYVEGFGYFELKGPELISDGIQEKKSCSAYSLEYTLAQKYLENFYINMGTVESIEVINAKSEKDIVPITLYNPSNPKFSLLHLVLEEVYGWKIGHIDSSLRTLSRQFEVDRESVYDFLMNEVCEKFNCYIIFDTINNTINVYAESLTAKFIGDGKTNAFIISPPFAQIGTVSVDGYKTTKWGYQASTGMLVLEDVPKFGAHIEVVDGALTEWETDVFVSFDNLAQEVNINYDSDEIKTQLTVTYGDDYDIREVNLGLPYLTDISYYYTKEWMGEDLYDAYTKYMQKSNNSQAEYIKNSEEILKWNDYIAYEENRLSLEYSLVESVNSTTVGTYYTRQKNADGSYYYSEVSLPSEYVVDVDYYSNVTTNVNEEKVSSLYKVLQKYFYSYFNGEVDGITEALDELKILIGFEFIDGYTISDLYNNLKSATTLAKMDTAVNNFLKELWPELGRTPLQTLYLKSYQTIQQTNIEAGWSNKSDKNYGNYYPTTLLIASIESAISQRNTTIKGYKDKQTVPQKENVSISQSLLMRNNFTETQLIRLSAFLREDELHLDDIVESGIEDLSSSFKIKQDAMESGRIELQKISQPRLQFSMTMANIYALSEFNPIINQFQLGRVIRVALRPDYIKQSRLLQVDINFDDFSDFSCEFGELTSLKTQSDIHADLLSQAITSGKQVAKDSYYWTRGSDIATSTDLKIQQGLLDATTQIKAIDATQGVVIDKYGIHLTKVDPTTGEVDPHQVWMVNNMILMSDDGFKTSRSALGEVTVDGQTYYGLIAELVLAGYIEGSRLVGGSISSSNYEKGQQGTHFDLDKGDFDIAGGKIVYDTDKDLLTLQDVTINWNNSTSPEIADINGLSDCIKGFEDQIDRGFDLTNYGRNLFIDSEKAHAITNNIVTYNISDYGIDILSDGGKVVVSFEAKSNVNTNIDSYPRYKSSSGSTAYVLSNSFSVTTEWKKFSFVTELSKKEWIAWTIRSNASVPNGSATAKVELRKAKLEYGNSATEWTSAPEDIDKKIDDYQEYSNSKISELDLAVGNYLGLGGSTLIGSSYVVSPYIGGGYLNITNTKNGSKVIIDPNNLTGTGLIFQVHNGKSATVGIDSNGNSAFAGKITTSEGNIAGWNIDSNAIYKNQYDSASNKTYSAAVRSGTSNSSVAFALYEKAGEQTDGPSINNGWIYDFYVGYNGKLYAKNAEITGKVTASSGDIGGWTIKDGCLYSEGEAYIPPEETEMMDLLWHVSFPDKFPIASDKITLYDFDGDGKLTIEDIRIMYKVIKGSTNFKDCPNAKNAGKSKISVTVNPSDPAKTICVSGTNIWGRKVEYYIGADMSKSEIATKGFVSVLIDEFKEDNVNPLDEKINELTGDINGLTTKTNSLEGRIGTLENNKESIDHLWSGSLSSGSCTFTYSTNYKYYIIQGAPASSTSRMSQVVPRSLITTTATDWQIADDANYVTFSLKYSGSTATLTRIKGDGLIYNVFGVK